MEDIVMWLMDVHLLLVIFTIILTTVILSVVQ